MRMGSAGFSKPTQVFAGLLLIGLIDWFGRKGMQIAFFGVGAVSALFLGPFQEKMLIRGKNV